MKADRPRRNQIYGGHENEMQIDPVPNPLETPGGAMPYNTSNRSENMVVRVARGASHYVISTASQLLGQTDQEVADKQADYYRQFQELGSKIQEQKASIAHLQSENSNYKQLCQNLQQTTNDLRSANTELRNHIFAVGTDRAPIKHDDYYVTAIGGLMYAIEDEMVNFSEHHTNQKLPEKCHANVLERISQLGPHGRASRLRLESPNSSLEVLYGSDALRNSLLRHVAALFLFDQVFEPFAFGISPELSDALKSIESDVKERGLPYFW